MTPRTLLLFLLSTPSAVAQQPPAIGYAFPAGMPAGSFVDVQLGGYDWTPDTQFFSLDDRVKIEIISPLSEMLFPGPPHWFGPRAANKAFLVPREITARISVAADMPSGVIRWRVANANGVSPVSELVISDDSDVMEDQSHTGSEPQQLPTLPCTVCGRLQLKEEVDRYQFVSPTDGLVTCSVQSQGFGFGINAAVQIHDSAGKLVADTAATESPDLQTTFPVSNGETYRITLNDIDYRGNRAMVYRMSLAAGPRVIAAFPAAGQVGTKKTVTLTGYGLKTSAADVETISREIQFSDHAEGSEQQSFVYKFETPLGVAEYRFLLSDHPEQVDQRQDAAALEVTGPSSMHGRLSKVEPHDGYRFVATKNDEWQIAVAAQSIGSVLDVALAIINDKGKTVAKADDVDGSTDASLLFKVPEDGTYTIQVSDVSGRVGELTSIYRLTLTKPTLTFGLTVPEVVEVMLGEDPPEIPKKRTVGKEPRGLLYVDVVRPSDVGGELNVSVTGLPGGMTAPESIVIPAAESSVVIPLSTNGSSLASLATITCRGAGVEPVSRQVLVAPIMKVRAKVRPLYPDAGRTVHRGATYQAPVVVTRVEDYTGEVQLRMAARPDRVSQGIFGDKVIVPAGVEQIDFPLFLPQWVQIDRTSRIALNTYVQIPDGTGNLRTLVNRMDQRITMNVEGTLLTISTPHDEITISPGKDVEIPVNILRSPKLNHAVTVSLVDSDADDAVELASVVVAADDGSAMLHCTSQLDMPVNRERRMTLKAVVMDGGRLLAMSTTHVLLVAP